MAITRKRKERTWVKERDYFNFNSYNLAVGVGQSYDLISEKVDARMKLRITFAQNYTGSLADWGKVQWDFLINGQPQYPLNGRTDQIGAPGQLVFIGDETYQGDGGDLMVIRITNLDAGAQHIGGIVVRGEWGNYDSDDIVTRRWV